MSNTTSAIGATCSEHRAGTSGSCVVCGAPPLFYFSIALPVQPSVTGIRLVTPSPSEESGE